MKNTNWIQLAESHQDEIIDALMKIYEWAAGTESSSWRREVHLTEDGEVHITDPMTPSTQSADIHDGTAVVVGSISEFDAFDGPGYRESIEGTLEHMGENGEEYISWCRENGEHVGTADSMNAWKPGLWDRFVKAYLEGYTSVNAQEWAEEQYELFMSEMKTI